MSQSTPIQRKPINYSYTAQSSPVYEFYERRLDDEERGGEEDEAGESDSEEDVSDQETDGPGEETRRVTKNKGKGKAVDDSGTEAIVIIRKSKQMSQDNDLNLKRPIIVLRTGEGWNWSTDALTTEYVRNHYELSGSYSSSYDYSSSSSFRSNASNQSARAAEDVVPIDDIFVAEDDWL